MAEMPSYWSRRLEELESCDAPGSVLVQDSDDEDVIVEGETFQYDLNLLPPEFCAHRCTPGRVVWGLRLLFLAGLAVGAVVLL